MTHLLDHGGGDGGDLASMCVRWGGDLIPSGDEADSVERRRRRDEEQWIRAGELPYRSRGAVDRSSRFIPGRKEVLLLQQLVERL